jgi:hypothetical protein
MGNGQTLKDFVIHALERAFDEPKPRSSRTGRVTPDTGVRPAGRPVAW